MTDIKPIPDWEVGEEVDPSEWEVGEEVPASSMRARLGGAGATIGPAPDDGQGLARVWQEAARKLKEAFFGTPEREEIKDTGVGLQPTPWEMTQAGMAGAAAMSGGATIGGVTAAAAPRLAALRAGLDLGGALAGGYAGKEIGEGAEAIGAPRGTAEVVGAVGAIVGGRGRKARAASAARKPAPLASDGPRTLHVPEGMPTQAGGGRVLQMPAPKAAPSAAAAQMEEITAKVVSLREKGLSGAQISSSLRQLYGIPPSQGDKMVSMILESMGSGPRVR